MFRSSAASGSSKVALRWLRCGAFPIAALSLVLLGPVVAQAATPIQLENARPGTAAWQSPQAPAPSVEAYTSEVSAVPGQTIQFHVSTTPAALYTIEVYRLGWYQGLGARLVGCVPSCDTTLQGVARPVPPPDRRTGEINARWPVTGTFAVPAKAVSGYYWAEVMLRSGPYVGHQSGVPFIVRARAGRRTAILVQAPVNTWQAYNDWGGRSLYSTPPANHISFDRPYSDPDQLPLRFEYPAVRFLERGGYDVSYTTDVDTGTKPSSLVGHHLVMTLGHSEYWSGAEYGAFEHASQLGESLSFLGANTAYWQVAYADNHRTIIGYKDAGYPNDPSKWDPNPNPAQKTTRFRDLVPSRPECQLVGLGWNQGRLKTLVPADYAVNPAAAADAWFRGTGLGAGSTVRGIVGYEYDSVVPTCRVRGDDLTVLFGGTAPVPGSVAPTTGAEAVRYRASSGALVFSAGSIMFSWGLDDWAHTRFAGAPPTEPGLQQFMRNALRGLLSQSVAAMKTLHNARRQRSPSRDRTVVLLGVLVSVIGLAGVVGGLAWWRRARRKDGQRW